jgi:hypothetical protein
VTGVQTCALPIWAAQLKELGYDSPGDFVDKLTSRIGALRAAQK